jgi:hypothetical protein
LQLEREKERRENRGESGVVSQRGQKIPALKLTGIVKQVEERVKWWEVTKVNAG